MSFAGKLLEAVEPIILLKFKQFRGAFDVASQAALLSDLEEVIRAAPFFVPQMPRTCKSCSVRMTNCGPLGWASDKDSGYRYQATHPETG